VLKWRPSCRRTEPLAYPFSRRDAPDIFIRRPQDVGVHGYRHVSLNVHSPEDERVSRCCCAIGADLQAWSPNVGSGVEARWKCWVYRSNYTAGREGPIASAWPIRKVMHRSTPSHVLCAFKKYRNGYRVEGVPPTREFKQSWHRHWSTYDILHVGLLHRTINFQLPWNYTLETNESRCDCHGS
jgi:hypothetical protein